MSRLARDEMVESVSQYQTFRRELGEGKKQVSCSADLGNHTWLIHTFLC